MNCRQPYQKLCETTDAAQTACRIHWMVPTIKQQVAFKVYTYRTSQAAEPQAGDILHVVGYLGTYP